VQTNFGPSREYAPTAHPIKLETPPYSNGSTTTGRCNHSATVRCVVLEACRCSNLGVKRRSSRRNSKHAPSATGCNRLCRRRCIGSNPGRPPEADRRNLTPDFFLKTR